MTKYRTIDCIILLSALVTGTGIANEAAAALPAYTVTDLTLGGSLSDGLGINANGQVTGQSYTTGNAEQHAFLWTPTTPNGASGTMLDLGTLGGTESGGYGVNASGQVAGYSWTTGGANYRAFLYDGTMHDLGTLGGEFSYGLGINDSGQVTGYSGTTGGDHRAFLYDGTMHDLGTLGGAESEGNGINARGQVTGYSATTGNAEVHAFLYDGTLHDLETLGGKDSRGNGINASGQVTGQSNGQVGGQSFDSHAFLYDGTLHDLGTLGGAFSYGLGINASGQVTGYSNPPAWHAFLYTSGSGMVDLNSLIDPLSGWELSRAWAINDAGQITGNGYIGGEQHAYLLTPVPEPATLALLAFALPILVGRNLRQFGTGRVRGCRRFTFAAAGRTVAVARSDQ
jgi:probable HAF family extracellular repeat protein